MRVPSNVTVGNHRGGYCKLLLYTVTHPIRLLLSRYAQCFRDQELQCDVLTSDE